MIEWQSTALDLLAQLTGGRGNDFAIVKFVFAGTFWGILIKVAAASYNDRNKPCDRLLYWGFTIALIRELILFAGVVLSAFAFTTLTSAEKITQPLEDILAAVAFVFIGSGLLCLTGLSDHFSRRFLNIGLGTTLVFSAIVLFWWVYLNEDTSAVSFENTWGEALMHSLTTAILLLLAYTIGLYTKVSNKHLLCITFLFLALWQGLRLGDLWLNQAYTDIFTPIRKVLYLLAIPMLGLAYFRELVGEIKLADNAVRNMAKSLEQRVQARTAELERSERRFRTLFDSAFQFIGLLDLNGSFIEINQPALMMGGVSAKEIIGKTIWETVWFSASEASKERCQKGISKAAEGQFVRYEDEVLMGDGNKLSVDITFKPTLDENGKIFQIIAEGRDISEAKSARLTIENALKDKTALLQEVHHRVKNNLQIITSLLSLQADHSADQNVINALAESQSRIKSMSLIHQQLYEQDDFARVDLGEYLDHLFELLKSSYWTDTSRVSLRKELAKARVFVDLEKAVPCGLLVNELTTNAFKHAFPNQRAGEIYLTLEREADGWAILQVGDNGIGMPSGDAFTQRLSLGLQLVPMLVKQIRGELSLASEGGTHYKIRFVAEEKNHAQD